ncbi:DEAD/DEAH box helicase family protein, partial [Candidatus Falkowbacteria bacterium]|nr:DEAD/DEAH box helicase family protein [Candidatus Falkowbacteria bacterium]
MIKNRPKFKTPEELQKQVGDAEELLGAKIMPREINNEALVSEMKEKYGARYGVYLQMLRSRRNKREGNISEYTRAKNMIQALNNLDLYALRHQYDKEGRILRDRQFDVFSDISKFLESGGQNGYIKLPTGVGKTILFSQVVESMGLKTMIVVPSKILVGQTGEKLESFTELEYGSYFQDEKDASKQVVTITYQSLGRAIDEGIINPKDFQLLILDEAHKALSSNRQELLKNFDAIKLGFTATPKYSEEKHLKDLLENEIH